MPCPSSLSFKLEEPILVGHSDGASIALIHAGAGHAVRGVVAMAPHVFIEPVCLSSIREATEAFENTDLAQKLGRYHRDARKTFYGWADVWLDPDFKGWDIRADYLPGRALAGARDPGARRRVRHDGAARRDRAPRERPVRAPQARELRACSLQGPARDGANGNEAIHPPDSCVKNDATVIGLISFAHGMSHFYQLLLAPLFPFIKDELGVSYAALGFLVALFYTLSGCSSRSPGSWWTATARAACCWAGVSFFVASTLVMGFSTNYAMLALGAALGGIGNSVFHPADFAILNARVSSARLGYAFSAHGVVGYVGYAVAPMFSVAIGAAFGWQAALLAGAALGVALLALLLFNSRHLEIEAQPRKASIKTEASVLFSAPVVLCFVYFTVFAAGLAGLQSFGVSAMVEQYRIAATAPRAR